MKCNFKPDNQKELDEMTEVFASLAHPKRLAIIMIISKEPSSVKTISEKMGCRPPCTSQHLNILKSANVVQSERNGHEVIYSVKKNCVIEMMDCLKGCELNEKRN